MKGQEQHKSRTVLFLCTGNYYRSRFAEHYFNLTLKGIPSIVTITG